MNERFPANLKAARRRAGYKNARAFAEAHDIPYSRYASHERGDRNPSIEEIKKYAGWLKTPYTEMLDGNINYDYPAKAGGLQDAGYAGAEIERMILEKSSEIFGPSEEAARFMLSFFKELRDLSPAAREKVWREISEQFPSGKK